MSVFDHYPNLAEFHPLTRTEANVFDKRLPVAVTGYKIPGELDYEEGCITSEKLFNSTKFQEKVENLDSVNKTDFVDPTGKTGLQNDTTENFDSNLFPWSPWHLSNEYIFPNDRIRFSRNHQNPYPYRLSKYKQSNVSNISNVNGYLLIGLAAVGIGFIVLALLLGRSKCKSTCKI